MLLTAACARCLFTERSASPHCATRWLDVSSPHFQRPRALVLCVVQGSTRAFPPHHPLIPVDYQFTGQPVMIGGTMVRVAAALRGTALIKCAFEGHMQLCAHWNRKGHARNVREVRIQRARPSRTLLAKVVSNSTCHGAGRARSRNNSRNKLEYKARSGVLSCWCTPQATPLTAFRCFNHQEVLDALKAKGISIRVASPKLVMEEAPESYKDVTQARGFPSS